MSRNGEDPRKKPWNRVVIQIETEGGQRGLAHHLKYRRRELTEAVCEWPDLLLKATQTVLSGPSTEEVEKGFAEFVLAVPPECLRASFGKRGLPERYDGLHDAVKTLLAESDDVATFCTFRAIAGLWAGEDVPTPVVDLICMWLGADRDAWRALAQVRANPHPDDSWWIEVAALAEHILLALSFAEGGALLPDVVRARDVAGWKPRIISLNDPRMSEPLEFRTVPWVVGAPFESIQTALCAATWNLDFPDELLARIKAIAVREEAEGIREKIRSRWSGLPDDVERWLPAGMGLTEVEIVLGAYPKLGVGILGIRVDPSGKTFPSLAMEVDFFCYGRRWTERYTIGADGLIAGLPEELDPHDALRFCVGALVAGVIYDYASTEQGDDRTTSRSGTDGSSGRKSRPSPAMFYHLPAGHRASAAAIERAKACFGGSPPVGMSFRSSPPITARAQTGVGEYDQPLKLKARLNL